MRGGRLVAAGRKTRRVAFLSKVKALGYASVDSFFVRNAGLSFAHMGRLVGMSFGGIQYHYRKWHKAAIGGARGKR